MGNNLYNGEREPMKKTEKEWSEISGWRVEGEPEEHCITEVEQIETTSRNLFLQHKSHLYC